ncbi:hypothetical protein [Alteromonas sp. BMJM2]|uniref:hypothetical protein n=1 Tax=Alteromonas sp. BMJM2 TaxID=2954241 RepID=UPI0022B59997|nr:hypothetical protein [Alteromonas sp. BMJM2]
MVKGACDLSSGDFDLTHISLIETASDNNNKKTVRKNSDDLRRSRQIFDGMSEFLKDADMAFVEIPVGSQTARAMTSYGICIGLLASLQVPLIQVTPNEVKLAGAGTKTASKKQMVDWATGEYPNAPWFSHRRGGQQVFTGKNEHVADALAAIYAGVKTDTFKQLIAFQRKLA